MTTSLQNKIDALKAILPTDKLRKNSKRKIQQLINLADSVSLRTQSSRMDDCWVANEAVTFDKAKFWEWHEANYTKMVVSVRMNDQGVAEKVIFSDCEWHFADDLILAFDLSEQEQKPRFTFEQVITAIADGYISPLNHDRKNEMEYSRKVVSLGDYRGRIEDKKNRLEERAEKAFNISNARYMASKDLASMIPFGQPILVGHHSEAKSRRHAEQINNNMAKSVEAQNKGEYLQRRANSVGAFGIASDDPEAIKKLKEKLASLEKTQEIMKSVNKLVKKKGLTNDQIIKILINDFKLSKNQAVDILTPDYAGRVGFAGYALSNNNANIRTTRKRIEELEYLHNEKPLEGRGDIDGIEWRLFEEEGRLKFSFDAIPDEKVRRVLKSNGFKFSRYSKAWVRKITPNAVATTKFILAHHFNSKAA